MHLSFILARIINFVSNVAREPKRVAHPWSKECITDLGKRSEMFISELLETTFKAIIIFKAAGVKIGSSLKPNHLEQS